MDRRGPALVGDDAPHRTGDWPDRNTEYLFYQTLVGAWPVCAERLTAYMEKASREAKVHTSWTSPHADYDDALRSFVEGCLDGSRFMEDVRQFVETLVEPGRINSLAQTLLKLTAPGVPDLYQGTELWSLHLVDPDNRRPVDYERRRRALADVKPLSPSAIWQRADEGLPKMWVTHAALQLRHRHRDAFGATSRYTAVEPRTARQSRRGVSRGEDVMTVVPRLVVRADGRWQGTTICVPPGHGERVDRAVASTAATWTSRSSGKTFQSRFSNALALEDTHEHDESHRPITDEITGRGTCARANRFRWEPHGTAAAPTSRSSRKSPSAWSLCLFDRNGRETRVSLPERTAFCWHAYLRGVGPGQRYGFRVHGPWDPANGLRCNPAKLLVDPYARAITGGIEWDPSVFPYPLGGDDLQRNERTTRRTCRKPSSWTTPLTGRAIVRFVESCTRRSSTKCI